MVQKRALHGNQFCASTVTWTVVVLGMAYGFLVNLTSLRSLKEIPDVIFTQYGCCACEVRVFSALRERLTYQRAQNPNVPLSS